MQGQVINVRPAKCEICDTKAKSNDLLAPLFRGDAWQVLLSFVKFGKVVSRRLLARRRSLMAGRPSFPRKLLYGYKVAL